MRRSATAAGWIAIALTGACEQPRTELVVRVDSEVAWGAGSAVQSVTLTVRRGGPTGPLRSARTTALGTGGERRPLPLLAGILPGDDIDTPVWIEALGCGDPNGCTPSIAVVAQRAVVRFTRGLTQELPLLLASACVGVTCASDQRCAASGRCESAGNAQAMVGPFTGPDAAPVVDIARDDVLAEEGIVADGEMDAGGVDAVIAVDAPTVNDLLAVDLAPLVDVSPSDLSTADDTAPCGALELRCGGVCVPALRDPMNCGDCGAVCPAVPGASPTCMGGRCGFACDATRADCDERASNGCEVALPTSTAHCGRCGHVCASPTGGTAQCDAGTCSQVCPVGRHLCGSRCANDADPTACGAGCAVCAIPANATATCVMGLCGIACGAGFADCDSSTTNGCETETRASDANCGLCGRRCATGEACMDSVCRLRPPGASWSRRFGVAGYSTAYDVVLDSTSNVYVGGLIAGGTNLGGGVLPSDGGFLASFSPLGTHRWSIATGDRFGTRAVAIDRSGNVGIAGGSSSSSYRVASYDPAGVLRWERSYGGPMDDVAIDGAENIVAVGSFSGVSTFGGGSVTSAGGLDGFLVSLTSMGAYRWSRRIGGAERDRVVSVSVDASNNVYVVGTFTGTVDLGDGPVTSVGLADTFVSSYSESGAFRWTRRFGGAYSLNPAAITNDASGNVYAAGETPSAFDVGGVTIRPGGYVISFSSAGVFRWSRSLAGSAGGGFLLPGLRSDAGGNVYIAGGFYYDLPVDLGAGPVRSRGGPYTVVIASYTSEGNYRWGEAFGSPGGTDQATALAVGSRDSLFVSGYFQGTIDFGNGPLTAPAGDQNSNMFLVRLSP